MSKELERKILFPLGITALYEYEDPGEFEDYKIDKAQFSNSGMSKNLWTSNTINNQGVFKGNAHVLDLPQFQKLKSFLETCIKDYLDNVLLAKYESFFIMNSWLNICQKGGFQQVHCHQNSYLSGVYYLNAAEEHPNLCFFKPNVSFYSPTMTVEYKERHPVLHDIEEIEVRDGLNVIFPSQIQHGSKTSFHLIIYTGGNSALGTNTYSNKWSISLLYYNLIHQKR